MELKLFTALYESRNVSHRQAAIVKVMNDEKGSTALIVPY